MPLKKRPRQQEEEDKEEEDRKRRRAAPDEEEELNRLCNEAMDRLEEEAELDRLCNEAMDRFEDEQQGGGFKFDLYPHSDKRAKKFGVHRRVFTSRLQPPRDLANLPRAHIPQLIERALQQAIALQILDGHERDNDILMINMSSNRLRHAYQSHRVTVGEWINNERNAQQLLEKITQILNSNEQFQVDDSFHIEVTHIQDPGRGSGRPRFQLGTCHIEKALRNKRSVIYINNQDELCCARALVTLQALREEGSRGKHYNDIKRGRSEQEKRAKALHATARVPEGPCGIGEIALFQIVLSEYQIIVVSMEKAGQIIYKGPSQPKDKQLILIKLKSHYHGCTSLSGFFGKSYYCVECEKGFSSNDLKHHRCPGKKCFACHQANCQDFNQRDEGEVAELPCHRCHRFFFGPICQTNHLLHNSSGGLADPLDSVCDKNKRCPSCYKIYTGKEIEKGHRCGHAECPCCKRYFNLHTHQCYVQPLKEKKKKRTKKKKRGAAAGLATLQANEEEMPVDEWEECDPLLPLFVYFDIEARQDQGEHVANLLCAERDDSDQCEVFEGETCVEEFLDWLREQTKTNNPQEKREVIAVAHNFQGYDSYFILEQFYKEYICPDQIVNGAKILSMQVGPHLKFIDSMCFLQMALANFVDAFGLKELKKGFFPHFFNTKDHENYVGPLPAKDYYDPEGMKPKRRAEFMTWYQSKVEEGYEFHFQQELMEYCRSDVRLLKEGCQQFQRAFQALADFNPMAECITIASACNHYYRKKCLQPFTIASEPVRGWHGKSKPHSHASMEWLYWINHQLRQQRQSTEDQLMHAHNQGEHTISVGRHQMHVDGFDPTTQTVYEFQGCFYHGCLTCFPHRDQLHRKHDQMSMRQIYQLTQDRNQLIREAGYPLVEMWECQWNKQKKDNLGIQNFLYTLQLQPRLEPRDAFFGGRTNAIQLLRHTEEGEQIHYCDYTSLYPWVNKNCPYPVGHPTIITQPESNDISDYFGLIKCTIEPPYELYHPVLPYRCHNKLIFPLCRTCTETELQRGLHHRNFTCPHTSEERALTGTWCSPELEEALQQGYKILKVHEIWHFSKQSTTLFQDYIDTFLKIKQEASGWPPDVGDDPIKQRQYLLDYAQHEGIELDPTKITFNPGLRSLAKMMLNSFWGKFGQQPNKCQVEAFTSPAKFNELLHNDAKQIHSIRIVNEDMLEVVHNHQDECAQVQININIFIACFTTCWARLKLYQGLKQLQPEQVLYFDTDSIIYAWKPGLPQLPLGNYLGEFTNELKPGDHIVEFAAAGPKNYAYKTQQGQVECKVRGFRLNCRGQDQLNFNILRNNVQSELERPLQEARSLPVWNPFKIVRDPQRKIIATETEIKRYQLVFDKRVVDPHTARSFPYGFQKFEWHPFDQSILDDLMTSYDVNLDSV